MLIPKSLKSDAAVNAKDEDNSRNKVCSIYSICYAQSSIQGSRTKRELEFCSNKHFSMHNESSCVAGGFRADHAEQTFSRSKDHVMVLGEPNGELSGRVAWKSESESDDCKHPG